MSKATETHDCGGSVLHSDSNGSRYSYCDNCNAFSHTSGPMPTGTDRIANEAAWNDGADASPKGGA